MADLSFSPNTQSHLPIFNKELDFGNDDPLSPTEPVESGLTNYYNIQSGLHVGPQADLGIYAGFAWSGVGELKAPQDGTNGALGVLSYDVHAGVKAGYGTDGVVGFAQGELKYEIGQSDWIPPSTESYDVDVYDDDGNVVGTTTEIYEIDGYHEFEQTGTLTTLGLSGYADTSGYLSIHGSADRTHLNGDGRALSIGINVGYDTEDGGAACMYGSTSQAISNNWSVYSHADACAGAEKSGVEAGIKGTLSTGADGIFSQIPVQVGIGIDHGGSPEARVSIFNASF